MEYLFKKNYGRASISAQELGEELEKIERRYGGIKPEYVVEEAKNNERLNKCFQWDDTIAGIEYRKWQARQLISSIEVKNATYTIGKYHNVTVTNVEPKRQYMSIEKVLLDSDLTRQLKIKALKEAKEWRRKYENIEGLERIHSAIKETSELIEQ